MELGGRIRLVCLSDKVNITQEWGESFVKLCLLKALLAPSVSFKTTKSPTQNN